MSQFNAYEFDMFEGLSEAMFKLAEDKEWSAKNIADIVTKRHCGDGYFSYDGILNDLQELLKNDELASEIVSLI